MSKHYPINIVVERTPVGRYMHLNIDFMSNEVFDVWADMVAVANEIERKYIDGCARLATERTSRRLYEDLTFKCWKLGAWSTVRIDAMERMNTEQQTYWLGGQP